MRNIYSNIININLGTLDVLVSGNNCCLCKTYTYHDEHIWHNSLGDANVALETSIMFLFFIVFKMYIFFTSLEDVVLTIYTMNPNTKCTIDDCNKHARTRQI